MIKKRTENIYSTDAQIESELDKIDNTKTSTSHSQALLCAGQSKRQMESFLKNFSDNPERLSKYMELMLLGDEASPIAYQSKQTLRRVAITLTTLCNLDCVWCHREEEHIKHTYLHRDIEFDKVVKLLPQLKGFQMLHWGGLGELTLYKRIYELTKIARQYIPNVKMTTNGTTLTPKVCDQIIDSGLTHLEVSIDGFDGETNKKFRGAHEDKILDYLKYFSDNCDIPIQINSVLADVNYDSLFGAIDRMKDIKNITSIHSIPLFMTEHMIKLNIGEITQEQHRVLIEHWHKKIDEYGLKITLEPDTAETEMDPIITMKRKHNICFNVFEDPFLNVDGYLMPCGRLPHIPLENVFEKGFDAAWNGSRFTRWRQGQLRGFYGSDCQRECHMENKPKKRKKP